MGVRYYQDGMPACKVWKLEGCQDRVTRPSYILVGRHDHLSLGPEKTNQKLGYCC